MTKLEEEMQQKYIEYQLTKQQINTLGEQKQMVDQKIMELKATIDSIKGLGSLKNGEEILTPLGSGVYIKTELKDSKGILLPIGMDITLNQPHAKAASHLEKNIKELGEIEKKINKEIEKHTEKISEQEVELQKMIEKHEKNKQ